MQQTAAACRWVCCCALGVATAVPSQLSVTLHSQNAAAAADLRVVLRAMKERETAGIRQTEEGAQYRTEAHVGVCPIPVSPGDRSRPASEPSLPCLPRLPTLGSIQRHSSPKPRTWQPGVLSGTWQPLASGPPGQGGREARRGARGVGAREALGLAELVQTHVCASVHMSRHATSMTQRDMHAR